MKFESSFPRLRKCPGCGKGLFLENTSWLGLSKEFAWVNCNRCKTTAVLDIGKLCTKLGRKAGELFKAWKGES